MIWEQMGQHEALYRVVFFKNVELLLTSPSWFTAWDILMSVHRGAQFCLPGAPIWLRGQETRQEMGRDRPKARANAQGSKVRHKIQATFQG